MNKKLLSWIILFCALGLGSTAAYYSIIGLSKLFGGIATAVIIMASFLEISKLTLATALHVYWKNLVASFKIYFSSALVILSIITSIGIYGMLSSGYQSTANQYKLSEGQSELYNKKIENFTNQLALYNDEKSSITTSINELRKGLSNNVIQYKDNVTGQLITTTSSSTRKSLENQLDQALERQDKLNQKTEIINDSIFSIQTQTFELASEDELSNELGPLIYLSNLTGEPMDTVVNYLLLTLIFVFDPLAISLIILANFSFQQTKKNPLI